MAGLVLGGIRFSGFEVPDKISFGGKHNIVIQEMIGGTRVFNAMGAKPDQITWSGRFRGPDAISRAQAIDELRMAGNEVDLSWLSLFRSVIIASFTATTEKVNEVTYNHC